MGTNTLYVMASMLMSTMMTYIFFLLETDKVKSLSQKPLTSGS